MKEYAYSYTNHETGSNEKNLKMIKVAQFMVIPHVTQFMVSYVVSVTDYSRRTIEETKEMPRRRQRAAY